mgnify:CR=1 FL=1
MDTRRKLNEAKYFLEALKRTQVDSEIYYILSAFLNAWRSCLDIMLYDFNEYYSMGFTIDDEIKDAYFAAVAKALKKDDALKFIKWWREKQGILKNNPLWKKRILIVHRGYPPIRSYKIYVSGSGGTSSTISGYIEPAEIVSGESVSPGSISIQSGEFYFSDSPNQSIIDLCTQAYDEMKSIIEEAEKTFGIKL